MPLYILFLLSLCKPSLCQRLDVQSVRCYKLDGLHEPRLIRQHVCYVLLIFIYNIRRYIQTTFVVVATATQIASTVARAAGVAIVLACDLPTSAIDARTLDTSAMSARFTRSTTSFCSEIH